MKWNSPVRDKSAIPYKFLTFIYVKGKENQQMDMEDTSKLKIFTGTAHLALAKEISDYIESRSVKQSAAASIMEKYRS